MCVLVCCASLQTSKRELQDASNVLLKWNAYVRVASPTVNPATAEL
jgi:hypothetical protein